MEKRFSKTITGKSGRKKTVKYGQKGST
ncbi:MAG: hypothetical protein RL442_1986, partial [Pseudomonadota bacterium]